MARSSLDSGRSGDSRAGRPADATPDADNNLGRGAPDDRDERIRQKRRNEISANAPRLPADLLEATRRFRTSEAAKRLFGAAFVEHFAMLCEAEDAALRRAVSAAEVQRYLEGG